MVDYRSILQMIQGGQNPQQLILSFLQNEFGNSPMGMNLFNLAKQNDTQGIEQIARNICSQKGIDFDKEFAAFRKMINF